VENKRVARCGRWSLIGPGIEEGGVNDTCRRPLRGQFGEAREGIRRRRGMPEFGDQ
jgi:hypothetical protein